MCLLQESSQAQCRQLNWSPFVWDEPQQSRLQTNGFWLCCQANANTPWPQNHRMVPSCPPLQLSKDWKNPLCETFSQVIKRWSGFPVLQSHMKMSCSLNSPHGAQTAFTACCCWGHCEQRSREKKRRLHFQFSSTNLADLSQIYPILHLYIPSTAK